MSFFKIQSLKHFLIHFGIFVVVFIVALLSFFMIYLPISTNHGESITVPDITGMTLPEVEEFLSSRSLRYSINDSTYSLDHKPLTVLSQHPRAGSKVKENRKIYVSINSSVAPEVKMPKLTDTSLKSAEMTLKSFGLQVGIVSYRKDLAQNAILEQQFAGKEIKPGTLLPKGSKIDLIVGDGLGETEFDIPDLIGMEQDDAETLLSGLGLRIGLIMYDDTNEGLRKRGIIVRQVPTPSQSRKVRMGEVMDIWVGGEDPAKSYKESENGF